MEYFTQNRNQKSKKNKRKTSFCNSSNQIILTTTCIRCFVCKFQCFSYKNQQHFKINNMCECVFDGGMEGEGERTEKINRCKIDKYG